MVEMNNDIEKPTGKLRFLGDRLQQEWEIDRIRAGVRHSPMFVWRDVPVVEKDSDE